MRNAGLVMAMMSIKCRCTCTARRNHLKASKQNDHSKFHYALRRVGMTVRPLWLAVFVGKRAVWLVNVATAGL
jgi:hypothetical protein